MLNSRDVGLPLGNSCNRLIIISCISFGKIVIGDLANKTCTFPDYNRNVLFLTMLYKISVV